MCEYQRERARQALFANIPEDRIGRPSSGALVPSPVPVCPAACVRESVCQGVCVREIEIERSREREKERKTECVREREREKRRSFLYSRGEGVVPGALGTREAVPGFLPARHRQC